MLKFTADHWHLTLWAAAGQANKETRQKLSCFLWSQEDYSTYGWVCLLDAIHSED